jgi:hypothetical protein
LYCILQFAAGGSRVPCCNHREENQSRCDHHGWIPLQRGHATDRQGSSTDSSQKGVFAVHRPHRHPAFPFRCGRLAGPHPSNAVRSSSLPAGAG